MAWSVVTTEAFDVWFLALDRSEQESVLAVVMMLESEGSMLGRPYVDSLYGAARVGHLKELRIQHRGKPYRVLFAFDPRRRAVLLCGGRKDGRKRFYAKMIELAEREYLAYLPTLE